MNELGAYKKQDWSGYKRVDLLLRLYEQSIESLALCDQAHQSEDSELFTKALVEAHKHILAIHSGLDFDQEIATNIARLLHYVTQRMEAKDFETGRIILGELHKSFSTIADEARALEEQGVIPPVQREDSVELGA